MARLEPYFNMRGGGPGTAPAMTKDFHAPGGIVAMDRFHDTERMYLQAARRRDAANDNHRAPFDTNPVCVDEDRLVEFSYSVNDGKVMRGRCAVYVIGEVDAACVKVGVANNVVSRLASLQTGNPRKLYVHRAFWFQHKETANCVEGATHRTLGKAHRRLVGEWFECNPHEAHKAILAAAGRYRENPTVLFPMPKGARYAA